MRTASRPSGLPASPARPCAHAPARSCTRTARRARRRPAAGPDGTGTATHSRSGPSPGRGRGRRAAGRSPRSGGGRRPADVARRALGRHRVDPGPGRRRDPAPHPLDPPVRETRVDHAPDPGALRGSSQGREFGSGVWPAVRGREKSSVLGGRSGDRRAAPGPAHNRRSARSGADRDRNAHGRRTLSARISPGLRTNAARTFRETGRRNFLIVLHGFGDRHGDRISFRHQGRGEWPTDRGMPVGRT